MTDRARKAIDDALDAWMHDDGGEPTRTDQILAALAAEGIGTYDTATHAAAPREPGRRWKHLKRGTEYTEVGTAELQMATDLVDGSFLVIYRGHDGKLWARQEDEFHDGRFVAIAEAEAKGGE